MKSVLSLSQAVESYMAHAFHFNFPAFPSRAQNTAEYSAGSGDEFSNVQADPIAAPPPLTCPCA
jgi:hypothetical protein